MRAGVGVGPRVAERSPCPRSPPLTWPWAGGATLGPVQWFLCAECLSTPAPPLSSIPLGHLFWGVSWPFLSSLPSYLLEHILHSTCQSCFCDFFFSAKQVEGGQKSWEKEIILFYGLLYPLVFLYRALHRFSTYCMFNKYLWVNLLKVVVGGKL